MRAKQETSRHSHIASALLLALAIALSGCDQSAPSHASALAPVTTQPDQPRTSAREEFTGRPSSQPDLGPLELLPIGRERAPLTAQEKADRFELAKEIANPVSNLARMPVHFTWESGLGPKHAYTWTMLAQPLIPIEINDDLNLVVQGSVPVAYVSPLADGVNSAFGLGDSLTSLFFVPTEPSRRGWIYGIGPAFQWPTATNDMLGTGKYGAGPAGAVVKQVGGWTYGAVAEQIWSYTGGEDRQDVNTLLLHPLVTYTFPSATSLTVESPSVYDWLAHQWTVPLQLSVSQVVIRGRRPVQLELSWQYFAAKPAGGPDWGLRFSIVYLFPNN